MNESTLILTLFAAIGLGTPLVFGTVGEHSERMAERVEQGF